MTSEFTEMKVHRLVLDPNSNSPIVILQDEESGALLPIWIGIFEAHSIAMKMEGVTSPRPMTHDLLSNTIQVMNGLVERVEVVDLVDNTYFAKIYFKVEEKQYSLDSRPSDAIALALRATSPIFVANHVLEKSKIDPDDLAEEGEEEDEEDLAEGLEAGEAEETPRKTEPPARSEEEEWARILRNYNPPGKDKLN